MRQELYSFDQIITQKRHIDLLKKLYGLGAWSGVTHHTKGGAFITVDCRVPRIDESQGPQLSPKVLNIQRVVSTETVPINVNYLPLLFSVWLSIQSAFALSTFDSIWKFYWCIKSKMAMEGKIEGGHTKEKTTGRYRLFLYGRGRGVKFKHVLAFACNWCHHIYLYN